MKKILIASGIAATLPMLAHAQTIVTPQTNVTLYGILDGGIGVVDRGGATSNSFQVFSGVQNSSRFGLRGTEDLGGGLKAVFNLEAGVSLDTGGSDSTGFFQRRAVAGLEGTYGTVLLGRDYTPGYYSSLASDVFGYRLFGSLLSYQIPYGASVGSNNGAVGTNNGTSIAAPAPNLGVTTRASNGIHYQSPTIAGGLRLRAMYASSERSASTATVDRDSGNFYGLSAVYTRGQIAAQAFYHDITNDAGNSDQQYGIGGGYTFGSSVKLAGGYYEAKPDAGAVRKHSGYNLGVSMKVGAGEVLAQAVYQELDLGIGDEPSGTSIGLAYLHPMSRRTNLYASYGQMRNNSGGTFGLRAAGLIVTPAAAGEDPKGFAVGIRHAF